MPSCWILKGDDIVNETNKRAMQVIESSSTDAAWNNGAVRARSSISTSSSCVRRSSEARRRIKHSILSNKRLPHSESDDSISSAADKPFPKISQNGGMSLSD